MIERKVTRFTFEFGPYTYEAVRREASNTDGWELLRREVGKPKIPPYTEILTHEGFENVINQNGRVVTFLSDDDVTAYVESTRKVTLG